MYCKNCQKDIELGPDGKWRLVDTRARICGQTPTGLTWHEPPENAYFHVSKGKSLHVMLHPPKGNPAPPTVLEALEIAAQTVNSYIPVDAPNTQMGRMLAEIASEIRKLKFRDNLWWQSCREMGDFIKEVVK